MLDGPLYTGYIDLPHGIEEFLFNDEKRPECVRQRPEEWKFREDIADTTEFAAICPQETGVDIDNIIVCPAPSWPSSGSHRVLIYGTYRENYFLMSVEEDENFTCGLDGNIVKVAAYHEDGLKMLEEGQHEFIMELLSAFLYCSTGSAPEYFSSRSYPHTDDECAGWSSKFGECTLMYSALVDYTSISIGNAYIVYDPKTIEDQGCELSEQADDCLLRW